MTMPLPSRFWADLTTQDFSRLAASAQLANTVAVLPVAATEQHGPHLPVSVDTDIAHGMVQASLAYLPANLPVLFLPIQSVGKSTEHIRFAGTLTYSADTILKIWSDIGASVARTGIKKLVLFNSHGGQVSVMDIVARDLRTAHDMLVFSVNWYQLPIAENVMQQFDASEQRFGIHGGDIETSLMLALRPDRVNMTEARHFKTQSQERAAIYPILGNGVTAKMGWQMQDYNASGAAGNAAAATAAKGLSLLASGGQQLAALLAEVSSLPVTALVNKN
jgi:creatinine amidohydrolase